MNIIVLAHRKVLVGERVEGARFMSGAQVSVGPRACCVFTAGISEELHLLVQARI